jgi:hypothetical protein
MGLFGVIFGLTVWTSMVDPGYRAKDIYEGEPERTGRNLICNKCNSYRDEGLVHCWNCGVCVAGWDHHCGVLGNCIAARNLATFRIMVVSFFVGFAWIFFNFVCMFCICYLEDGVPSGAKKNSGGPPVPTNP